ncbi:unnamed protein product [Adineta ricciae]|uniref:Uncharacterized protein n=1 Tax=Adineta ricciae TaxID=249248 RepID=A0A813S5Q6_ADIRI|nr:unnamed protein product [Adineta ricciae]
MYVLLLVSFFFVDQTKAQRLSFDTIVSFGDSNTDTGRVYELTQHTWPITPPYYQGRYSNGPVWIERLGVSNLKNYAYGGATTDDHLVEGYAASDTKRVPGIRQQIQIYLNETNRTGIDFTRTLYVIWAAGNDYYFSDRITPFIVAASITNAVKDLIQIGVRHLLVINSPPIHIMPFIRTKSQADYFRRRTIYHNNNLSLALDKLDYNPQEISLYLFDIYSLILNLTTSNSTNALKTKNCWEVTNGNVTALCPNPDLYAYIDQNHFSARMHDLIGHAMLYTFLACFLIIFNLFNTSSTSTTAAISSLTASYHDPLILNFLVFSSNLETAITFDVKVGWILNEQRKFRIYLSGVNLHNSSIVFTSTDECLSNDYLTDIYPLTSTAPATIDVELPSISKSHSIVHVCLLTSSNTSFSLANSTTSLNATKLEGAYFTLVREKGRLPFAAKICLILMLFIISGFYSGLNLGLMSMSVNDLSLIAESEDGALRYYAQRVLPLRKRGNFLLCSIVIANVLVNSLGTVLLDSLVHGLFAVIGSTIMIVLMGEIIPQAICSRYGLVIGAHTHVITWVTMILTGVISYPLGFILNKILGQEVTASYTRDQIARMLTRISADIEKPEMDVITGVLSLRKKTVQEAMTWLPDVFMIDKDRKTDTELLLEVHKHGFSRIPVYSHEKSNVIGIVKLRDFALITPEQYHLTVKHLMEFHTHPFGFTKTTDSLYNLMQEFLKSRWHIALVQELRNEEDNVDPVFITVGVITLEDVIEEMLQREIIEEADFFTDNRRKIQRKRAKTMDYTALVKRPVKGPSVSPQLKVAVFQYLSTNVQQFTSGFISHEILKILLNYNIYAMIKHQANQTTNAIYLYKKGFRYELFTLVMQGSATLESGVEHIMSTVGPFSCFAGSALLAENKTVKDVHQFLDQLFTSNSKSVKITNLLDEISSIYIPDYNVIVNSELHVLQIHRLVWLAAVRATQKQRGSDTHFRRMQPEQLLSHALDEISSVTNVPIDKTNLTNFQRIFQNEKDLAQTANGIGHRDTQTSSSVFEVIHSLSPVDTIKPTESNQEYPVHANGQLPSEQHDALTASVICNPLLLSIPAYDQINGNGSVNGNLRTSSSNSTNLTDGGFNSSMHINRMFDDALGPLIDDERNQDDENLIDSPRNATGAFDLFDHPAASTPISPQYLVHARSDNDLVLDLPCPPSNDLSLNIQNETVKSLTHTKRSHSTKCSAS